MRLYHKSSRGNQTLVVQPGKDHPNVSDWHDAQGNALTIAVEFKAGAANVPSNLGRYLLDEGLAQETMLLLPEPRSVEPVRRGPILIEAPAAA